MVRVKEQGFPIHHTLLSEALIETIWVFNDVYSVIGINYHDLYVTALLIGEVALRTQQIFTLTLEMLIMKGQVISENRAWCVEGKGESETTLKVMEVILWSQVSLRSR